MPIYEYKRVDGSTFEVIQKFSDEPLTKDPETGEPVERVYTAPAIHFKGSGFHNTDYSSSRRAKAGQGGPSESASDSSGSSDAKTSDSKSESKGKSSSESTKSKDKK
ncbi:MAG: zinc ribbon domain-containing protein [Solirubrobacterales bacterium]